MDIPNPLVEDVRQQQAVLFAGAGMSYPSLGILASHLRDTIGSVIQQDYREYNFEHRTFEDVCDEYVALYDRPRLVGRLAAEIPRDANPTPSHIEAVKAFRSIITTNWDLLFEEAYRQTGQVFNVFSSNEDALDFRYEQPHNLLKIHGSVDRPQTLIVTSEDYESYADTHDRLLDVVARLLDNTTVLFVGYGLRDQHVRQLLTRIRRTKGDWARRHYAVGYFDRVRTRLLAARKIETFQVPRPTNELSSGLELFMPELVARAGIH